MRAQITLFHQSLLLDQCYNLFKCPYSFCLGPPEAVVLVEFEPDSLSDGLELVYNECPAEAESSCSWFDIQTSDGKSTLYIMYKLGVWRNATQSIVHQYLQLSVDAPDNTTVTGVRFGFSEWPVATLYNSDGFPATPFCTNQ